MKATLNRSMPGHQTRDSSPCADARLSEKMNESTSENSKHLKIVMLGDSGVGKTSIIFRYVFGEPDNVRPTIGSLQVAKTITYRDSQIEMGFWDTAGQEVYRSMAPMYYRGASIAIIVYDITRQESYESVDYWLDELTSKSDMDNITILVVGNKVDLSEYRQVSEMEASNHTEQRGGSFFEVSAMSGVGIDRLFQTAVQIHCDKSMLEASSASKIVIPTREEQGCYC